VDLPHEKFFDNFAGFPTGFGIRHAAVDVLNDMKIVATEKVRSAQLTSFVKALARGTDVPVTKKRIVNKVIALNNRNNHF
jgi:hypothetical protein